MKIQKGYFQGKNCTPLYFGQYFPDKSEVKALVLFIHGVFETFESYERLARRLVNNDIGFVSFDCRGSGKSGGTRGYVQSYEDWLADIDIFLTDIIKNTTVPLFLLAYSMGSIIGLAYILKAKPAFQGVILTATGYHFKFLIYTLCRLAQWISKLFPGKSIVPPYMQNLINSHNHTDSPYNQINLDRLYPEIGTELLACFCYVKAHLKEAAIPVFMQCADHDFFFRKKEKLFQELTTADKTYTLYKNSKHDLYMEIKPIRTKVIMDLLAWIQVRTLVQARIS